MRQPPWLRKAIRRIIPADLRTASVIVQKYYHGILNRVIITAQEKIASILPYKWVKPGTIPLVY